MVLGVWWWAWLQYSSRPSRSNSQQEQAAQVVSSAFFDNPKPCSLGKSSNIQLNQWWDSFITFMGRDGALVESIAFNRRIVGSTPALAVT